MKLALTILLALMLAGCATINGPNTPCQRNARRWEAYYKELNIPVRRKRGWYKGQAHMWAEHYDAKSGEWLLCRDTVGGWHGRNGGWPTRTYGDYSLIKHRRK